MQTVDTHRHNAETNELWYMLKGSRIHVVNREVYVKIRDVVPVAPSIGHSLINAYEPLQTFYFAHYE